MFLRAEPLIVARVKEVLPSSATIATAPDLAGVTEGSQPAQAVYVVYGGHRVNQTDADGLIVELEQKWHTVVAVRNVRDIKSGEANRSDAGKLLQTLFEGLTGYKLAKDMRRLNPMHAPLPGYRKGYGYYPLTWSLRLQLRGVQ